MSKIELSAEETAKLFAGIHAIKNEFQIEELLQKFFKKFYDKGLADGKITHERSSKLSSKAISSMARLQESSFWLTDLASERNCTHIVKGTRYGNVELALWMDKKLVFETAEDAIARAEELLGHSND